MSEWITAQPNPEHPETLPRVRLFAVLGTWMEADIVAATVRNVITQGCERVYLVDNDSPDDTVAVARSEGAIVARSYATERYDELLRLQHMNEVVAEVSAAEPDDHLWWLFLDADEFHHGPFGMTLREYVKTLDRRFRVVGMRCFDHYPDRRPAYVGGRHPLDFQPLCEELAFPMCPSRHRKHPLLRWDRHGTPLHASRGFHFAHGTELHEPAEPAFLHHFPYREEAITRKKLQQVWAKTPDGTSRALESHDTHMLARARSLDAVYAQDWAGVVNFIALDPMYESLPERPPATGVMLRPWAETVPPEHQHVLRGYSAIDAWRYDSTDKFAYGDDTTYQRGLAFLDGQGAIEDWGCGYRHAREFITKSEYSGVDGSSQYADLLADLRIYTSAADCIFMRHVLEHNVDWRLILANAVQSFTKRMALVIFTPFAETTRVINTSDTAMSTFIPDISFKKEDLTDLFRHLAYREESLVTDTQYGREHVFYIEKKN